MTAPSWNYNEAFKRNLGLINPQEQDRLRNARVAIVGQGGVGGIHLITLARLGIGKFTIADPDTFEAANFNRQFGATVPNLGQPKTAVMARLAKDINPEIDVRTFQEPVTDKNADEFLKDADIFLDGIDAYEIGVRRLLFKKAREKGLYGVTAAPNAFGSGWLIFEPHGVTFDDYFDLSDSMDDIAQLSAFFVGLTPAVLHRKSIDLSYIKFKNRSAPSASCGCHIASGIAGTEIVKILLQRGPIRCAPNYSQFDAYSGRLKKGRLWFGNRGPLQRLLRWRLDRMLRKE